MGDLDVQLCRIEEELGITRKLSSIKDKPFIMLVDDDPNYLKALEDTLQSEFQVIVCSSGSEALSKLKERLSAIVLDIKMPNMDGLQVLEKMAERNIRTPVILNTGFSGEYSEQDIRSKFSPFSYVTKDNNLLLQINLATVLKCLSSSPIGVEHFSKSPTPDRETLDSGAQPLKCIELNPPFQLDWIEPRLIDSDGHSLFMSLKLHDVLRAMLCTEPGTRGVIRGAISDKAVASLYSGKDIHDPEEATRISMNFRANLRKTFAASGIIDREALIRRSKTYGGYVMGKYWHPKKPLVNQSEVNLSFREIRPMSLQSESNYCDDGDET